MAGDLQINTRWTIPSAELIERFSRSSGPGGQSVNTADSRVELSFDLAGSTSVPAHLRPRLLDRLAGRLSGGALVVVAGEHRGQLQNRRAARQRLAEVLRLAAEPPPAPRRATAPSRASTVRRLDSKRRRANVKRGRARPPGNDTD